MTESNKDTLTVTEKLSAFIPDQFSGVDREAGRVSKKFSDLLNESVS